MKDLKVEKNNARFCHKLLDHLYQYMKRSIHFDVCLFFYCSRKDIFMLLHSITPVLMLVFQQNCTLIKLSNPRS